MNLQTQFCHTYSMCWISDSSEIVFQLVVEFDLFMCKFLSGAFGSAAASLQPISNLVLFIKAVLLRRNEHS